MATILAYGDSLTWGFDPRDSTRHDPAARWPTALAEASGQSVIAEGLNGRTTAYDDHTAAVDRNGARLLPSLLSSHAPLDLVILMLGTNDLKPYVCGSADGAVRGMARLVEIVRHHVYPGGSDIPKILIVAPPTVIRSDTSLWNGSEAEESRHFALLYSDLAETQGCAFFDAGSVAQASPLDGIHLDADNTRAIGLGLAPLVRALFDPTA